MGESESPHPVSTNGTAPRANTATATNTCRAIASMSFMFLCLARPACEGGPRPRRTASCRSFAAEARLAGFTASRNHDAVGVVVYEHGNAEHDVRGRRPTVEDLSPGGFNGIARKTVEEAS